MTRRILRLVALETRLAPAIATWDGGGANANWTTVANWVGDVAPNPGDDLVFPAGAAQLANSNDFAAGTAFQSIRVTAGGYQIGGNSVSLAAGVSANIPNAGVSTLALVIGGTGGLAKAGAGTLVLSGANTYTGVTTINAGFLEVQNDTALGATGAGNNTVVNDSGTLTAVSPPPFFAELTINESITLNGQGAPAQSSGFSGALRTDNSIVTFTGSLTLASDSRLVCFDGSTFIVGQGIGEVGGSRSLHLEGPRITFAATSVSTYSGTTFFGGTDVATDLTYLGHGVSRMVVENNAILDGTGTVGPMQVTSGEIRPGWQYNPAGALTFGGLNLGSGSRTEFVASGLGANKLIIHGTVQLGGALNFFLEPEFSFPAGARLTLIDNDGSDSVQGTFAGLPEGALLTTLPAPRQASITYHGGDGNDVQLISVSVTASAVGAGAGGAPIVQVFDTGGRPFRAILAYDSAFRGGVRVATADLNGDLVPEVITAPGPGGGPVIRIWDGVTGAMIRQFNAYDPNFRGGVFLATANLYEVGVPDIITGAGAGGGPHVKVFDPRNGNTLESFLAYDSSFFGGVSVAGFNAQIFMHAGGFPGIIVTGAGSGGGPHVKAFTATFNLIGFAPPTVASFLAYDASFHGGVNVAGRGSVGFNASTANLQIITAPASQGGPDVRIYDFSGHRLGGFLPYAPNFFGGVTIAIVPIEFGSQSMIITGAGPGGGPHVEWWALTNAAVALRRSFFAFDPAFLGGVFVG